MTGRARGPLPRAPEPLWTFEAADGFEATVAITPDPEGGTVYAATLGGKLHALSLADGARRWTYEAGDEIKSSPLVAADTVYFGDEGGTLHAVDAETGAKRWTFEAQGAITGAPNLAGSGSAEGKTSCLLVGSYDNFLYCLDPGDGSLRWKAETQSYVHASPAVAGKSAVVAGCDGLLRRVDLATGKEVAQVPLAGYAAASPAVEGNRAFVATYENQVQAVDLEKNTVLWSYEPEDRQFPFYASAAVADRKGEKGTLVIAAGRDKRVHGLDAQTGEARWTFSTRARIDASPVVVGDRVGVAGEDGVLRLLDVDSGEELWSFDTGSSFLASPAVAGGKLVIGTVDGVLFCFG